jgi:putative ABC transport system substrate-binding protein
MRRRDLVILLGGSAIAAAFGVRAQQAAMPVIGFLNAGTTRGVAVNLPGFRQGLADTGFVEGRNVAIEYRIADGHLERLPELAADLVRRGVDLISAGGGDLPAKAAKAATRTIPIVFTTGVDPVAAGLVASLNRPGGNATGISILTTSLEPKRLEILHEMAPAATLVGILLDASVETNEIDAAARSLGLKTYVVRVSAESELDGAFAMFQERKVGAVLFGSSPVLTGWSVQLVALATRHSLPAIFENRNPDNTDALVSYGPSTVDAYLQAGTYAGRILKGEKPADLPILQPTKFDLVINLKTAKTLGLAVPPSLLVRADEVIE